MPSYRQRRALRGMLRSREEKRELREIIRPWSSATWAERDEAKKRIGSIIRRERVRRAIRRGRRYRGF